MLNNISTDYYDPVGIQRRSEQYSSMEKARFWGEIDGYNGDDADKFLKVYQPFFERIKERLQLSLQYRKKNLKAKLASIEEKLKWTNQRLLDSKYKIWEFKKIEQKYSLFEGLLYSSVGLIFLLAELAISMKTVANGLGMDIDFSYMTISDFSSMEGLFLGLAIAFVPFVLKLWIDRYLTSKLAINDIKVDRIFKWLFLPIGSFIFVFLALTGMIRWIFQPMIMDESLYNVWESVFSPEGSYSIWGLIFLVLMVLVFALSSAFCLSKGFYNLKGVLKNLKIHLSNSFTKLKKFLHHQFLEKKYTKEYQTLLSKKEEYQIELRQASEISIRNMNELNRKREAVEACYTSGHDSGSNKKQQEINENEQRMANEVKNLPPHLFARHIIMNN